MTAMHIETLESRRLLSVLALTMDGAGNCVSDWGVQGMPSMPPSSPMTAPWTLQVSSLMNHTHLFASLGINVDRTDPNAGGADYFQVRIDGSPVCTVAGTPAYLGVFSPITRASAGKAVLQVADSATVAVVPLILQPGDYFDVSQATVFASGDISIRPLGYPGSWGEGGTPIWYRIFRDGGPAHPATVYWMPNSPGSISMDDSAEMRVVRGATPAPAAGYFQSVIPAGATYVDVELAPTDTIWTDGAGVQAGNADTPITLTLFHPSALGIPDDLEAYDSAQPSAINVMKTTKAGVLWWVMLGGVWKQRNGGALSITGATGPTTLNVKWKIAAAPAFSPWTGSVSPDINNLGKGLPFTVVPAAGALDAASSDWTTVNVNPAATAGDGGDLVISVWGSSYHFHITDGA